MYSHICAPAPLGHEDARADQAGGVELNELHVLERNAGRVGHADAASVVDQGVRRVLEDPPVPAGAEEGRPCAYGDELAGADVQDDDAVAATVFDAKRADGESFRIDLYPLCNRPLIQGVEQHVAGNVGSVAGPRIAGAAEGALGDGAVGEPAEGTAPVLHLIDDRRRLLAHQLRRVLIGEIIAPLDRIEGMLLPGVVPTFGVVGQGRVDPALCGDGMGARRVHFGDESHIEPVAKPDGRPKPRQTTADDEDIVLNHYADAFT